MSAGERARDVLLGGGNLGTFGIKWLAETTSNGFAQLPGTSTIVSRVLGGLQFNNSFSRNAQTLGCNQTNGCPTNGPMAGPVISPEQAFYNVLRVYFDGTKFGDTYGGTSGHMALNYIQVWASDISYASTNAALVPIVDAFDQTNYVNAQMEFSNLSVQILEMAEPSIPVPPSLSISVQGTNVLLIWPASAGAFELQANSNLAHPDRWKANTATRTLINGSCAAGGSMQVLLTPSAAAEFYRLATP